MFRYQPQVTLRQDVIRRMTPAQRADWCASDPNQILKYDAASGAVSLGDVEAYAYDRECIIRAAELGFPTAIEIAQKQDTFIFTVEATGALPPAEIVLNGALLGRAALRGACNPRPALTWRAPQPLMC